MTKHNDSTNGGKMNEVTISKLRTAREALAHQKKSVMAAGGNPYDGMSDEALLDLQALVCSLASAAQAECNAITDEILRRQPLPPG